MDFERIERSIVHMPCAHGGRKEHESITALDFSANVNPLAPCPALVDVIQETISRATTLTEYPDSTYAAARSSISTFECVHSPRSILPTNGAIELISLFFSTFVRPGDEGIITLPTFCEYERFLRQAGGVPAYGAHGAIMEKGLTQAIIPLITNRTRAMALCNPNNPTGDLVPAREVLKLAKVLDEADAMLLVDEAFIDLVRNQSVTRRLEGHENIVVCRSLTKILGVPGIRTGYGIGHPRAMELMARHQMPWSVNSIARAVLESIGAFTPFIEHSVRTLRKEQAWLVSELTSIPNISVHPSSAWYIMLTHRTLTSQRMVSLLREKGILVRGCHSFVGGGNNSIRVAVKHREDNARMLAALRAVCTWN